MGDELKRLASYEAECHRKDGVIAALRDEVVDLKGALQSSGSFRYINFALVSVHLRQWLACSRLRDSRVREKARTRK